MLCPLRRLVLRSCVRRLQGRHPRANQHAGWIPYRALPRTWFHAHTQSLNPVVRATVVSRQLSHCGNHRRWPFGHRKSPLSFLRRSFRPVRRSWLLGVPILDHGNFRLHRNCFYAVLIVFQEPLKISARSR